MDWVHCALLEMFILALIAGIREGRLKVEYWRYWQEELEYAAKLEKRLVEYEGEDEDEMDIRNEKKPGT